MRRYLQHRRRLAWYRARQNAWRRGVLGRRSAWRFVAIAMYVGPVLWKVFGSRTEVVSVERLAPGQGVVITRLRPGQGRRTR